MNNHAKNQLIALEGPFRDVDVLGYDTFGGGILVKYTVSTKSVLEEPEVDFRVAYFPHPPAPGPHMLAWAQDCSPQE